MGMVPPPAGWSIPGNEHLLKAWIKERQRDAMFQVMTLIVGGIGLLLMLLMMACSQANAADGFTIQRAAPEFTISRVESPKAAAVCTCPKGGECLCGPACECFQPIQLKQTGSGGATSSPSASNTRGAVGRSGSTAVQRRAAAPTSKPRAVSSCANGQCGTMERRGLFGRRR